MEFQQVDPFMLKQTNRLLIILPLQLYASGFEEHRFHKEAMEKCLE